MEAIDSEGVSKQGIEIWRRYNWTGQVNGCKKIEGSGGIWYYLTVETNSKRKCAGKDRTYCTV